MVHPDATAARPRAGAAQRSSALVRRVAIYAGLLALADFAFGAVYVTVLLGRGLTPAQLGLLFGISTGVSMLVEAPSGAIADRYGHRTMLTAGLLLWGLALLVVGVAATWPATLLGLLLWTTGMALQSGTTTPIVVAHADGTDRRALFQKLMRWSTAAHWVCSALGAATVFLLGDRVGGAVFIGAAGVLVVLLGVLSPLVFTPTTPQPELRWRTMLASTLGWSLRRETVPLLLASVASGISMTAIVVTWQPALSSGPELRFNGLVLLALTIAAALGSLSSRAWTRVQPTVMTLVAFGLVAIGLAVAGAIPGAALPGYLLAEFGLGLSMVGFGTWQHLEFPDDVRNTLSSTLATVALAADVVASTTLGLAWQYLGLPTATLLFAGAVAALAVVAAVTRRSPGGAE